MKRIQYSVVTVLLFLSALVLAEAGKIPFTVDYDVQGVSYADSVPSPERTIGHRIGSRHTRSHQVVDYYRAVDAASERVIVREHGATYEGRPLIHAIVTSPENQSRLEEIRQSNLRLSDQPHQVSDSELAAMPVIITMGYSIHGNEASGTEAALLLLYHLAAGQGAAVEEVLQNAVIIIDPNLNPDGRSRFVNWVNGNRGRVPTSDPQDREHTEPWPQGRTNHYWFDQNRDWLPAQLKESRGRVELFHHWRPHFMTDFHEMGSTSTYFFQPGVPARINPNTPQRVSDLTAEIAEFHARALDRRGSLYYSQETYDDFYYGKGSTYPDINGSLGILFEQASSRSLQEEVPPGILHYDFTIANQFTTSLSSLEAAVSLREKFLRNQRDFYREAEQVARDNPVKAYVLSLSGDRTRALALLETLQRHRIRVHELRQPVKIDGRRYEPGASCIIPLDQLQTRLITAMMERVTEFEDSIFYDISTWTLPLAFGVESAELRRESGAFVGEAIDVTAESEGRLEGNANESTYAYLMDWGRYYAPRALYRLLDAGIYPRLLTRPLEASVGNQRRSFKKGTIIIPVNQQGVSAQAVHETIGRLVREDGVIVSAVSSGYTPAGPELGGPSSLNLEKPCIALLSGSGTSAYQVGETWFLLNERMGIPISLLNLEDFGSADLSRYNTLVLVSGSYDALKEQQIEKLKSWVHSGGLLIAIHGGAKWVAEKEIVAEQLKKSEFEPAPDLPYEDVARTNDEQEIAGAIFQAKVDATHPIAYGYDSHVAFFRDHTNFFEISKTAGATVARYTDDPLLSGYISREKLQDLKGTAAIIAREVGEGRVVLFADNPNFRTFWYGTNGLFLNAIFFGRVF
ncbi:MAG: M14 family zinc carboxypeptidase [Acidobacteriota bacterium]